MRSAPSNSKILKRAQKLVCSRSQMPFGIDYELAQAVIELYGRIAVLERKVEVLREEKFQ